MRKNNRHYQKSVVSDHIARYGKEMQPTEIKTKRHIRRYIVMRLGNKLAERFINAILYGGPPRIVMVRNNGRTALRRMWEESNDK